MSFVMTSPAVSKPPDKGVTTSTSHTAPGSSLASPLSSRSNPPQSQVVTRRTHDFSGALNREEQLINGDSLFQLEDTCGRLLNDVLQCLLLERPRCCGCGCCYWCCCCCHFWQVKDDVQSVLTALSSLSVCLFSPPFLPFCLFG